MPSAKHVVPSEQAQQTYEEERLAGDGECDQKSRQWVPKRAWRHVMSACLIRRKVGGMMIEDAL